MSIDKIDSTKPILQSPAPLKLETQKQKTDVQNEEKSNATKYMVGATILAAAIAVGFIGHKNNWWKKAVKEGENLTDNKRTKPIEPEVSNSRNTSGDNVNPKIEEEINEARKVETSTQQNSSINISELRSPEAVAAEFSRVASREMESFPINKTIIDEALADRANYCCTNPTELLKAKGILFEVENCVLSIKDKNGKLVQKIEYPYSIERLNDWSGPVKIEYFDPESGTLTKILESDMQGRSSSLRIFKEDGNPAKELFLYNDQNSFIVKEYSKGLVPEKLSVFNLLENKMRSCVEYNIETGYPKLAYCNEQIYTPRINSTSTFGNILETADPKFAGQDLSFLSGYGDRIHGEDYLIPRLTKAGYIIKNGNKTFYPDNITLLDFTTHQPIYSLDLQGSKGLILKKFDPVTQKPTTLFIDENGSLIGNKFDKPAKEVLEEMIEIITDITPDLYEEVTRKTPELIREYIAKNLQP